MRFEHLVEINDPQLAYLVPLNRTQVWAGLMRRVEDSRPFLPGLDTCEIVERGDGWVSRRLSFGTTLITDRVSWSWERSVCFDTQPDAHHGGGRLDIAIEEPEPKRFFLRFSYQTSHALGAEREDAAYEDFLRQAYEAADLDTVQLIRLLARSPDATTR